MYICVYMYKNICIYVCICIFVYIHMYIYITIYVYIPTYICMYSYWNYSVILYCNDADDVLRGDASSRSHATSAAAATKDIRLQLSELY